MDSIMLGISWVDACGTKLVDATTLYRLENTLSAIRKERGKVTGVRWLELLNR